MLKSIMICFKHRRFVQKTGKIDFSPGVNIVIGPNGSGKSSLLSAIHTCPDCVRIEDRSTNYHYYNGELMNPHRSDMKGNSLLRCRAMFASHGESMRDVLACMPLRPGDTLLLDEPESGQDVHWMARIKNGFRKVARLGCQLIVATHHPVLIDTFPVIELQRGYVKKLDKIYRDVLTRNEKYRCF